MTEEFRTEAKTANSPYGGLFGILERFRGDDVQFDDIEYEWAHYEVPFDRKVNVSRKKKRKNPKK